MLHHALLATASTLITYQRCNTADTQLTFDHNAYPILTTEHPFLLTLMSDEVTYGPALPSITALDETTFAMTWAGSPITRNINYNENIYCRLFYIDPSGSAEPHPLHTTITVNTLTDRMQHLPQISALSDHNNQVTDTKRFVISWHSDIINGDRHQFDGIYTKLISWDYDTVDTTDNTEDDLTVILENINSEEIKVNEDTNSIIGHIEVTPLFDTDRFIISWLSWSRNGDIYRFNTFCKMYNLLGHNVSNEFSIGSPSSKVEAQPSITPLFLSSSNFLDENISRDSSYFVASWTVQDSDMSGVSGIYSSLILMDNSINVPIYSINETVVDGGIDVYDWTPSDGIYSNHYQNHQVDGTYLMTDYVLLVWCRCVNSKSTVQAAIYYIDETGFVNVFDDYTVNIAVHDILDGVNVTNPTVDTITCSNDNQCDISICYQYEEHSDSKTYCSFWRISNRNADISMDQYYGNDVQMTPNVNHSYFPVSCSWDRVFHDISNVGNARLLVVDQVTDSDGGHEIYGRIVEYSNRSMYDSLIEVEMPDPHEAKDGGTLIVVVIICCVSAVGASICYYYHRYVKNAVIENGHMGQSKVGNRLFAAKSRSEIADKFNRFKRGKRHRHQELSGVDEDELDDEEDIELGNDDDRRTRAEQRTRRNRVTPKPYHAAISNDKLHEIGDDSATSSSDEITGIGGIGGGPQARNFTDSSSDSQDEDELGRVTVDKIEDQDVQVNVEQGNGVSATIDSDDSMSSIE